MDQTFGLDDADAFGAEDTDAFGPSGFGEADQDAFGAADQDAFAAPVAANRPPIGRHQTASPAVAPTPTPPEPSLSDRFGFDSIKAEQMGRDAFAEKPGGTFEEQPTGRRYLGQPFEQGLRGLGQAMSTGGSLAQADRLRVLDNIDLMEKLEDQRNYITADGRFNDAAYGQDYTRARDIFSDPSGAGRHLDPTAYAAHINEPQISNYVSTRDPARRQAIRDEISQSVVAQVTSIARHEQILQAMPHDPALQALNEAKTETEAMQVVADNPHLLITLPVQSAPASAAALAGFVAAGPLGGGGVSFVMERGSAILDSFREAGVDVSDPATLQAAFGNPIVVAAAKEAGLRRGLPVALFDALTGGIATKTLFKNKVGDLAAQTGVQAVGGGAGEAAAQVVNKEQYRPGAILAEFGSEVVTGAPEAGVIGLKAGKFGEKDVDASISPVPQGAKPGEILLGATPGDPAQQQPLTGEAALNAEIERAEWLRKNNAGGRYDSEIATAERRISQQRQTLGIPDPTPPGRPDTAGELRQLLNDPRTVDDILKQNRSLQEARQVASRLERLRLERAALQANNVGGRYGQPIGVLDTQIQGIVNETPALIDAAKRARTLTENNQGGRFTGQIAEINRQIAEIRTRMGMVKGTGTRQNPLSLQSADDIAVGADLTQEPTEAQAAAGNYGKRHLRWEGLDISIETEQGGIRTGTDAQGKPWQVEMPVPYGYIRRTTGKDGDQLDVYMGPNPQSQTVYIVDQVDPITRKFDEHKVMLGFDTADQAGDAYDNAFSDGKGPQRLGTATAMTVPQFKEWLKTGNTRKAVAYVNPTRTAKPADLISYIIGMGGIRDVGGELESLDARTRRPGLVNNKQGLDWDHVRERLVEAGYLPEGSDVNDTMRAVDEGLRGRRILTADDQQAEDDRRMEQEGENQRARYNDALDSVKDTADGLGYVRLTTAELREAAELVYAGWDAEDALADVVTRAGMATLDKEGGQGGLNVDPDQPPFDEVSPDVRGGEGAPSPGEPPGQDVTEAAPGVPAPSDQRGDRGEKPAEEGPVEPEQTQTEQQETPAGARSATFQAGDTGEDMLVSVTLKGPWDFNDTFPDVPPDIAKGLIQEGRWEFQGDEDNDATVEEIVYTTDEMLNEALSYLAEHAAWMRRLEYLEKGQMPPKELWDKPPKGVPQAQRMARTEARRTLAGFNGVVDSYSNVFGFEAEDAFRAEVEKRAEWEGKTGAKGGTVTSEEQPEAEPAAPSEDEEYDLLYELATGQHSVAFKYTDWLRAKGYGERVEGSTYLRVTDAGKARLGELTPVVDTPSEAQAFRAGLGTPGGAEHGGKRYVIGQESRFGKDGKPASSWVLEVSDMSAGLSPSEVQRTTRKYGPDAPRLWNREDAVAKAFEFAGLTEATEEPAPAAPVAAEPEEPAEAPQVNGQPVQLFASGMSRIGDLNAGTFTYGGKENRGIGVDVGELSKNGIDALAAGIVDRKARVFIDSGAFSLFRRNMREGGTEALDFAGVMKRYDDLDRAIEKHNAAEEDYPKPLVVMPDIVGDQKGSLDLVARFKAHIAAEASFNLARPIVPIQKGELTLAQAYAQVVETLGTDRFIVGIPANKLAVTPDEFRDFLAEAKPKRIHFLGAASLKRLTPYLQEAQASNILFEHLSADANLLRGKLYGKPIEPGARGAAIVETLKGVKDVSLGDAPAILPLAGGKGPARAEEGAFEADPHTKKLIALAKTIAANLESDASLWPMTKLQKVADAVMGGTLSEGTYDRKDLYDAAELALNMWFAKEFDKRPQEVDSFGARAKARWMREQLERIGTQTVRSEEQLKFQQFSTPADYAYAVVRAANIGPGDRVMEPSAGTGNLAVHAMEQNPEAVYLNELAPRRAAMLRALKDKAGHPKARVFTEDAEQLDNILPDEVSPTVVVMNPPFSQSGDRLAGQKDIKVASKHIQAALDRLEEGGRLVAIVGRGMTFGAPAFKDWWKEIASRYTVQANIGVAGEVYRKNGTDFATRVLVIDKTGPAALGEATTADVDTVTALIDTLEGVRDGRKAVQASKPATGQPGGQVVAGNDGRGSRGGRGAVSTQPRPVGPGERGAPPATGPSAAGTPQADRPAAPRVERPEAPQLDFDAPRRGEPGGAGADARQPVAGSGEQAPRGADSAGGGAVAPSGQPASAPSSPQPVQPGISIETIEDGPTEAKALTENVFEPYKPQKVRIPGAQPHPGALVQSAAMAAVSPPNPTYTPSLAKSIIDKGLLSDAQLETVVYAGQAHAEMLPALPAQGDEEAGQPRRQGYFIGDGTGVGKGREISGIILDNFNKGRTKAIWVSEKEALMKDAQRDWRGLGQDPDVIFRLNKTKVGDPVREAKGIGFITYDSLRSGMSDQKALARGGFIKKQRVRVSDKAAGASTPDGMGTTGTIMGKPRAQKRLLIYPVKLDNGQTIEVDHYALQAMDEQAALKSRLDQIVEWAGPDFDGVIALDEAHNLGNAIEQKGSMGMKDASAKALAGLELQKRLPNARIVYVSATGATEVSNLSYGERLGLWGPGTAFAKVSDFIANIEGGGIAAMELVSRDMKALGVYLARSLSYDGVEYDKIEHTLTDTQTEVYDELAGAWQMVLANVGEIMKKTGADKNARARSAFNSQFWGAHQRFFNQVITALQMPSVLTDIEGSLKAGEQVVLQLVSTNAASTEREVARAKESGEDIDDLDLTPRDQLISFIRTSYPTQQYEEYVDPDSGKKRSRLVTDAKGEPVENKQAVAERERLIDRLMSVRVPQSPLDLLLDHFGADRVAEVTGRKTRYVMRKDEKTGERKRVEEQVPKSARVTEADAFQDGKKDILVFSQAGGTGRSYHADKTSKTAHKRRRHILLQAGWRADVAVQGFGRTHRTNQGSAPRFGLASTNLSGQKRFISSIARRLSQLGALTKGQRQAGDQGAFSSRDNLENREAKDALNIFWRKLASGNIEGITIGEFEKQSGLKLRKEVDGQPVGGLRDDLPQITTFLNRLLSFKVAEQNRVFGAFDEILEGLIQSRTEEGTLDTGMTTYRADKIEKVKETPVYTDKKTGAVTNYVSLRAKHKTRPVSYEAVLKRSPSKWVRSARGKFYAVVRASNVTTKEGDVIEMERLVSPTESRTIPAESLTNDKQWARVDDDQAPAAWEAEIKKVPEFDVEPLHLITGTILPIWDRLKGDVQVVRLQTDDGEVLLGRRIKNDNIQSTLEALGVKAGEVEVVDLDTAHDRILEKNDQATLANGWVLKRSRVAGEDRIEIIGITAYSEGEAIKAEGAFSEIIAGRKRHFIPTGADAIKVMKAITERRPIVRVGEAKPYAALTDTGLRLAKKDTELREENLYRFGQNIVGEALPEDLPRLNLVMDQMERLVAQFTGDERHTVSAARQLFVRVYDTDESMVSAQGVYSPGERLIVAAIESNDVTGIIRHEMIHMMRNMGFLPDTQWAVLERAAREIWMDEFQIAERYANQPYEVQLEEAIAEAFRYYRKGNVEQRIINSRVKDVFRRIVNMLNRVYAVLKRAYKGHSGQGEKLARLVFDDIEKGRFRRQGLTPKKGGGIKLAREDLGGVPVIVNPSRTELRGALAKSAHGSLRGFVIGNDLYIWDAAEATHDEMAVRVGKDEADDTDEWFMVSTKESKEMPDWGGLEFEAERRGREGMKVYYGAGQDSGEGAAAHRKMDALFGTDIAVRALEPNVKLAVDKTAAPTERYPRAGAKVDGLDVGQTVHNTSSIAASLDAGYKALPGIRELPLADFDSAPNQLFYAADDHARVRSLAREITDSGRIDPLIVVIDKEGPYILEGAHRLGALHTIGAKAFPAMVVMDVEAQTTEQTDQGEQLVIPGAEKESAKKIAERRGEGRLRSRKSQKGTEDLPLFDDAQKQTKLFLARPPGPNSTTTHALVRQREMMRWIGAGQPIDRAIRLPFQFFGGVDAQGRWNPGKLMYETHPGLMTGAIIGARAGAAVTNPIGAAIGHYVGGKLGGAAGAQVGEAAAALIGGLPGAAVGALTGGAVGALFDAKISEDSAFRFMGPIMEAAKVGLIDRYGLQEEYVAADRKRALDERRIMKQAVDLLKALGQSVKSTEEWAVLQAILTGEAVGDAEMQKLAQPVREAIDLLGQEAVHLGLISAEAYERNRGAYLHRVYLKHEAGGEDKLGRFVSNMLTSKRRKIIGDELKGRGLFFKEAMGRLMRDVPGWVDGTRGNAVKGEKYLMLDRLPEQEELEGISSRDTPKVVDRVFWPADQPIPPRFADYTNKGEWEVREVHGRNVTIWRDYTKAEREKMGEILDARYTITKTFMLLAHDLATGRFYKGISENAGWALKEQPAEKWVDSTDYSYRRWVDDSVKWVKVPNSEIPKSGGKKKWGALADMYVRAEIWRDLNELDLLQKPSTARRLMTMWKLNKTARSIVVHTNNVVSNFLLADMADVRAQDIVKGLKSYMTEDANFHEANDHGVFGADMISIDLRRDVLKPILEDLRRQMSTQRDPILMRMGVLGTIASGIYRGWKAIDRPMVEAYRAEDDIFRMAAYMRHRSTGLPPADAAAAAREEFIDYDIRAPWVNVARNTVLPFISYSYRATPLVARMVGTRPWKFAKYASIAFLLGSAAYMLAPGDEDDERKSLREAEQGNTWMGTPQMMRMPFRDNYGNPVFLDVRRWIPAGDVFDMGRGEAVVPMPAPLQMGGPLLLGMELYMDKSAFTGEAIVPPYASPMERATAISDYLYKAWMPSSPWIPGSWYWEKVGKSVNSQIGADVLENIGWGAEPRDTLGRPLQPQFDIPSAFGVKLKPQDVEFGLQMRQYEITKEQRGLKEKARQLTKDYDKGMMTEATYNSKIAEIDARMDHLTQLREYYEPGFKGEKP